MTDMTVAQVAELCGVTERTVRRWLKEGRLQGMRVGGRVRIDRRAVGELAAPYGDVAADPVPDATRPVSPLRAFLEDPERLAAVRARRAARTMELLDRVRALALANPAPPGALDPRASSGPSATSRTTDGTSGWGDDDASVVVRWFLWDEPFAGHAATLRQSVLAGPDQAVVPGVCWMEVSHALARAVRRGRLPNASVEPAIEALAELMPLIDIHEVDPVTCLRIALELGLGAYDSAYLVLSRATGQSLITADRRLFEVGTRAGYDLVWLGDMPLA